MKIVCFVFILFTTSCIKESSYYSNKTSNSNQNQPLTEIKDSEFSATELYYISNNLIDVNTLDSSIRVALLYSSSSNFLNKPIYKNNINKCYLPCDVAIKLCNAQYLLKKLFPYYSLIVFDAVRPLHIQKEMWEELKLPTATKINYLAHPNDLSLHNYGAAVDVGIIGDNNLLLDMGTPFDYFGELSQPKLELKLYKEKKLSKSALANRLLLRKVMTESGFTAITSEWWHFNATNKLTAAAKYKLIK